MTDFQRYAVYYAPRPGVLADLAGRWLGRNVETGIALTRPELPFPLAGLTVEPRRYGFHGTLRAPFRPSDGLNGKDIAAAVQALASQRSPVHCAGLCLENIQSFIALTPRGCEAALLQLGATVVEATDALRSPLSAEEIMRRRPDMLTSRQRVLMELWGYPYVMEEFRFHLTLTDRLADEHIGPVIAAAKAHFAPVLATPFVIEDLCVFGEEAGGVFRLIHRYPLSG
jgi:Protein of unknown function (DUF1045)